MRCSSLRVARESQKNTLSTGVALGTLGLLLLAPAALATPADARRAMDQNEFGRALLLYEKFLGESPEDARLHYNAGAAAYRAGDFEKARNHFNSTLASSEAPLPLQQRAFYNLGNAMFRLGENTENPDDKAKQWIDALKKYEGAFELSQQLENTPNDKDAKFNTDIVKARLEKLKQQQQQQNDENQDKENQDKNEQQQEQQQQKSGDQKKQEQEQQQKDGNSRNNNKATTRKKSSSNSNPDRISRRKKKGKTKAERLRGRRTKRNSPSQARARNNPTPVQRSLMAR
ncbi:MAG: hypothetical protein CM1200mP29_06890 [Verrucomicrobiota bacterium]|nr:MAG: hypothetical protein CM1200mP29_06890 [Verrucomicrobiota bacterium]